MLGVVAVSPQPACKKDDDFSGLQGTWIEVGSGKKLDLDAQGLGFGPYGALGVGCGSPPTGTATPPFRSFGCDEGTCNYVQLGGTSVTTESRVGICSNPCDGFQCGDGETCAGTVSRTSVCIPAIPVPLHALHTTINAFGEFLIAYGDDAGDNANLVPCGPCTLDEDGGHLSCKQSTHNGGLFNCEFDRLGGPPGAPDATTDETLDDASVPDTMVPGVDAATPFDTFAGSDTRPRG